MDAKGQDRSDLSWVLLECLPLEELILIAALWIPIVAYGQLSIRNGQWGGGWYQPPEAHPQVLYFGGIIMPDF